MSALDLIPTENASRQVINSIGHWHPASRPDTFIQTNSDAEEIQSHQHTPVTTGDLPEAAQDLEDFNLEDAPDAVQARVAPETRQEKDQHEQENQHDALQNPQRHEVDDHVPAPRVVSWAANRASTLTFEIPDLESDEDEERLDPAWGIKRTDSVQILQGIDRSTSFPAFEEQMEIPESAQSFPLPHSQAEDIMHHLDLETVTAHEHEVIRSPMLSDDAGNEDWARSANDYIEDITSRVVEPQSAIDKEIRFEEGLPLISTDNQMEDEAILGQEDHLARSNPFAVPEEEGSFFDKLDTQHHHVQIPPPLDRKTTADVLDHLGSHPDDPSDSPVRESSKMATPGIAVAERPEARHGPQTSAELYEPSHGTEDPWAAALDDEEFLVDDDDDLLPDSAPESPSSFSDLLKGVGEPDEFLAHLHEETSLQRTPPSAGRGQRPEFTRAPSSNPYAPHQPSTSDLAQLSPTRYGNIGFSRPALAPMNSFQQQLQQRPVPPQKTESFVDQKGGYKSPYDLPMEIAKPRKRQSMQPVVHPVRSMPPPPPRTSSMTSSQGLQSPFSPTFPPGQGPVMPPPSSRPGPRSPTVARPSKAANPAKSSFFEELPVTSRPRPATGQGRYTPQQNPSIPPPQLLPRSPPQMPSQPSPPQARADPYAQYQLRAPEKLDPYANVPLQVPSAPVNPVINTRYSPNPTAVVGALRPSPSPRYSPVPPPQAAAGRYAAQAGTVTAGAPEIGRQYAAQPVTNTQPPQANLPFQPRTSSPLAYMGRSISDQAEHPTQQRPAASQFDPNTLPTRHAPQNVQNLPAPPSTSEQWLPRRPQTQSPGGTGVPPSLQAIVNGEFHRPASVPGPVSPTRGPPVEIAPPARPSVRQRGMTGNFNFIEPTDGQERDELHRWKGAPIFNFAFGGSVVSSFPKHVPRYGMGSAAPMIKPSAGEVHVRNAIQVIPVPEHITTFPGPLRSKSKKREVLAWLKIRITALEETHLYRSNQIQQPDPHNRHDEKVLLWKIVQALVEHDGVLDGSPASQKAVSAILSPEVHSLDDASATQYGKHNDASGIYRPTGSNSRTEIIDADAVESVRKQLIRGEREAAVWIAVDKRLWSHALLIASTLEPTVWKQVVQEFVRQEVKTIGNNIEPLAALYEVFAGNFDESIDELVPPSARAGLQMVSKVDDSGPTKNALDGLDRWRETLSLVLNNRTNNDSQALIALGKLLIGYGRIEAAHICHLSARSSSQPALFAGADEPQAGVVLLGADHHSQPTEFFQDEDAILLTEIYEFAVTVLASNPTASMPYLQVYKLQRASLMADSGHKAEAQAYCEAISASFKATTKMSPYYNPIFFAVLEELTSRLKQIPIQSSSSWAKPSVEKVTNSLFNRLGNFIAGDDSDAESKGSGKDVSNEFGPFANVAGTPSLSREGSSSDLYGNYPVGVPIPTTTAGSRYAPGSINTARSSSELARGRPSLDSQRSPPSSGRSQMPRPNPYEQSSSFAQTSYLASQSNMYQPMSQSPPINRYQATPPQTSYMPQVANESPQRSYMPQRQDSYVPTPPPDPVQSAYIPTPLQEDAARTAFGGYASPEQHIEPDVQQQLQSNGYEASAQNYGAFEPSSGYVPYEPELDSPEQKTDAPKKKSFMDDDEDDSTRVTNSYAPQSQPTGPVSVSSGDDAAVRKRANDAAADAAFRAVAEADAARAKDQTLKPKASGWFSVPKVPFFGGKQDDSLDSRPVAKGGEPTVYRAKLGEAKMKIYYDEKLKKWINPDNPDSAQAKAPPPPPMRGPTPMSGPPRVLTPSATMPNLSSNGTGSGPPSRVATPVDNVSGDRTLPPSGLAGGLAPPSRPATGLSNASSLDDLIGPATGRRTVKGKKGAKGRYIDVMAK